MRDYFRSEARADLEVVLFLSYEAQARLLLSSKIDVAWNTNLADAGTGEGPLRGARDARHRSRLEVSARGPRAADQGARRREGVKIALGSHGQRPRRSCRPLAQAGSREQGHLAPLRLDVGKHGGGDGRVDVLKAVLEGEADAGFVGSPFWARPCAKGLVPTAALQGLDLARLHTACSRRARTCPPPSAEAFKEALFAMSFDDPKHRPILEAEGLKKWTRARRRLRVACARPRRRRGCSDRASSGAVKTSARAARARSPP
ncbi:MAG: hypothetical protein U0235_06235 [Polyangiaceae bacterium]